jgi:hypothetical protein
MIPYKFRCEWDPKHDAPSDWGHGCQNEATVTASGTALGANQISYLGYNDVARWLHKIDLCSSCAKLPIFRGWTMRAIPPLERYIPGTPEQERRVMAGVD